VTDITRAWPVSGTFSPAQKDLYNMILEVQRDCVKLCRQSERISLDGLHSAAEIGLKDGLKALGFDMANNVSFKG
jgi:intermediate cleaving peptidase 55